MSQKIDMRNKRFGKLLVLRESKPHTKPSGQKVTMWTCKCDCGKVVDVAGNKLRSGHTTSCGCHRHELNYKHGYGGTRLHKIWVGMIHRCYDSKTKSYENYGGRGIKVCKEWLDDFMVFYNWANNNGYQDDLSIDRIDVNKNYEPSNCRWADVETQANNTRKNVMVKIYNKNLSLSQWAKMYGMKYSCLYSRWYKGVRGNDLFKGYHLLEQIRG